MCKKQPHIVSDDSVLTAYGNNCGVFLVARFDKRRTKNFPINCHFQWCENCLSLGFGSSGVTRKFIKSSFWFALWTVYVSIPTFSFLHVSCPPPRVLGAMGDHVQIHFVTCMPSREPFFRNFQDSTHPAPLCIRFRFLLVVSPQCVSRLPSGQGPFAHISHLAGRGSRCAHFGVGIGGNHWRLWRLVACSVPL